MKYIKIFEQYITESKKFKIGDKWSEDFDYAGMLAAGLKVNVNTPTKNLNKLFDSFTDVNYHTVAKGLGIAIDLIEDGDKKGANEYMDMFHKAVKEEAKLNEAKDYSFIFNYNTDEDDIQYIQKVLDRAGADAVAKAGIDSEEMVIRAFNSKGLKDARKAIEADGFEIQESVVKEGDSQLTEGKSSTVLSNQILDFLEKHNVIKPNDAQRIHKDLIKFLIKKQVVESVVNEAKIDLKDFKKIKKGSEVLYMGGVAKVIDNDGYVLILKDEDGKVITVNKGQFDHGGRISEVASSIDGGDKSNGNSHHEDHKGKSIAQHWKDTYGEEFHAKYPAIAKIVKSRPGMDRRELKRIWDETYGENFEEQYPALWQKID